MQNFHLNFSYRILKKKLNQNLENLLSNAAAIPRLSELLQAGSCSVPESGKQLL